MQLICLCRPRVRFLASYEIFFILDATSGTPVWEIVAFMCNEVPGSKCAAILPTFFCVVEANAHDIRNLHDLHVQVSPDVDGHLKVMASRSEEHTSELQSLIRISYAVFCLKKQKKKNQIIYHRT